jgi:plastocyanin/predicted small secreted protein
MRKFSCLVAPVLALALVLASCGDDDGADVRESGGGSGSGSESGSASGNASGQPPVSLEGTVSDHGGGEIENDELELELDDNYFAPTFVRGTPGEQVTVELVNEGNATHTFTSDSLGVDEELSGGDSSSVSITLPEEGAVAFHCRFHEAQGMKGAFYFNEGDQVEGDS